MTRGRVVARLVNQGCVERRTKRDLGPPLRVAPHQAIRRGLRDAAVEENFTVAPSRNVVKRFGNATSFLGHHISATFERSAGVVKAHGPAERVEA